MKELWIVEYNYEDYDGDLDEYIEGVFKGTQDEVIEYVHKRDKEVDKGFFSYSRTDVLN